MENLIQKELSSNAKKLLESNFDFSPSYNQMRADALNYFNQNGIPTKKHENWLYTSIAKTLAPRFETTIEEKNFEREKVLDVTAVLIFNNGHFNRAQSVMPEGLVKTAPNPENSFHDSFDALNMVAASDAISFNVQKNTQVKKVITLLHLVDENGVNKQISPRIHFNVDEHSELTILEIFTSTQNNLFQYTTNAHTSFKLAGNSKVKHVKFNLEANLSTHIGLTKAFLDRDSTFETYLVDLGNLVARNNFEIHLNSINAITSVSGLFNLKQNEHSDVYSEIHHHSPHTSSEQLYKGILNHNSHGAFTGKIIIDHGANGVNSNQLNKNLLLSKKAHIDTRPQLIVSNDDVKCSHGATVGELSPEEEFYLTSRGIPKSKARQMLAIGFAHEVMLKINNQEIFNFINKYLETTDFNL